MAIGKQATMDDLMPRCQYEFGYQARCVLTQEHDGDHLRFMSEAKGLTLGGSVGRVAGTYPTGECCPDAFKTLEATTRSRLFCRGCDLWHERPEPACEKCGTPGPNHIIDEAHGAGLHMRVWGCFRAIMEKAKRG